MEIFSRNMGRENQVHDKECIINISDDSEKLYTNIQN